MSQIVTQGDSFGQILIEAQGLCHGSGYLGNLQGVGQTGTIMVAPGRQENLRMLQTTKGLAVQNPIPVSLIDWPDITGWLIPIPPSGILTQRSIRT